MNENKIEQLKRERGQLEDELRRLTKDRFFEVIGTPDSMITTAYAAALLNISERTIYRWKASGLWLPRLEDLDKINGFLDVVEDVRASSAAWVKVWKKAKFGEAFPESFRRGLLGLHLSRAMEDVAMGDAERAEVLTGFVLRELCNQLRGSKEA